MEIKIKVYGIVTDQNADSQIVLLRDDRTNEVLPIWVGPSEGNAIRFAMEGILPPRPLSHDLLRGLLESLRIEVIKAVVTAVKENTYYASLYLRTNEMEVVIDARPSDAIALALRAHAPIYVEEDVLRRRPSDNLDAWLSQLNPKDYGKHEA